MADEEIAEAQGEIEDQGVDLAELGDPGEEVAEPWDESEDE